MALSPSKNSPPLSFSNNLDVPQRYGKLKYSIQVYKADKSDERAIDEKDFDRYTDALKVLDKMINLPMFEDLLNTALKTQDINVKFYNANDMNGPTRAGVSIPEKRTIKLKLDDNPLEVLSVLIHELCNAAEPGLQPDRMPRFSMYQSGLDYALAVEKIEWLAKRKSQGLIHQCMVENEGFIKNKLRDLKLDQDSVYDKHLAACKSYSEVSFKQYCKDGKEHIELYIQNWESWNSSPNKGCTIS